MMYQSLQALIKRKSMSIKYPFGGVVASRSFCFFLLLSIFSSNRLINFHIILDHKLTKIASSKEKTFLKFDNGKRVTEKVFLINDKQRVS